MRNEAFGRLLKGAISSIAHYEGMTAPIVEDQLGQQIGLTGASIQRYKAGHLPPELRTIDILAMAAVKRGYLNRAWLQAFLRAAHYPAPEQLIDKLCPIGPVRERPARIYENLPAPTYSQFVMREQAFADVTEGLTKRSAAVLIVGFGGNGKTSLAREVAACCLVGEDNTPQFDAAVWVSDKDRPGTTNLSIVLDEIARTLDYPGFTQFEHAEKHREVEQLLRRQRVLIVVDNFETVTDGALLSWLLNLPEPSKALITTREYRREFRRSSWPVDLRGMTEDEARELIAERIKVLKIEKLVGDLTQLEPLVVATGGNPKAIEMTMGLLKYERHPLQQVVDDLYAARGDLFEDLFARAWSLLDEAARRVLLVMTFFPDSASGDALRVAADVEGFAFDLALERLTDLALLDVQQNNVTSMTRYTLHPLVRAYAGARLKEQASFESESRNRWIEWYTQLVSQIGYSWDDIGKLDRLDFEQENIYFVICWVFESKQYNKILDLCRGCNYYYHQRGKWDRSSRIYAIRAETAQILHNPIEQVCSLAYNLQLKARQGKVEEAGILLDNLLEVTKSVQLRGDSLFEFQHALALYHRSTGNMNAAQAAWERSLEAADQFTKHRNLSNIQWLGVCLLEQGKYADARRFFLSSQEETEKYGHQRFIETNKMWLALIDLAQGNLEQAQKRLAESEASAEHSQDRATLADIHHGYARLHLLRGDLPAACKSLTEAIDLFERLGMRRELAEAREELARLEATIASAFEPAPA
jgi:tetratricopeptide (TPR) repeat protein